MSIFPTTDLVVDVARAADPQKLEAAVARLQELSTTKVAGVDFASVVEGVGVSSKAESGASRITEASSHVESLMRNSATQMKKASGPMEQFEAFIIQSCLETILPKSEQGLFGHGSAGGIWRSMIAEQIANEVARAGGVGLRKVLDSHWTRRSEAA
jgi:hypothetical protein